MSWLQARRMLGNSAFMLELLKALATAFLLDPTSLGIARWL